MAKITEKLGNLRNTEEYKEVLVRNVELYDNKYRIFFGENPIEYPESFKVALKSQPLVNLEEDVDFLRKRFKDVLYAKIQTKVKDGENN